jgi:hypothetical protein
MDPLQQYILTCMLVFMAYAVGVLTTEAKHEGKGKSRMAKIKIFFNYFFE